MKRIKLYSNILKLPSIIRNGRKIVIYPYFRILKTNKQLEEFLQYCEKKYPLPSQNKLIPNAPVPKILNHLKHNPTIDLTDRHFIEFFEIYDLEFAKIKSFRLNKKCGGRYVDKLCCKTGFWKWRERDFVITKNGLLYHKSNNSSKKIGEYLSFNKYFQYSTGLTNTGYQFGIKIKAYHRLLLVTANSFEEYVIFIYYLEKTFREYNAGRYHNPYSSFSMPKQRNDVEFYVDGEEYFGAVAEAISNAKSQVMIAGWWISPEFYLVRPVDPKNPDKNRLSGILKQIIQKNNVKIFLLAYRQSPMFLSIDSNYTKQALEKISPNIKVITHPANFIPSLWSHHQKIIIIDQAIAFVGGLDLCYGRYDTNEHLIHDKENLYPGIEFNNQRIKDFCKVRQFEETNILRSVHPRLPWHDVSMKVIGESVQDISKHFIQYWNFASYENLYQERIVLIPEDGEATVTDKIKDVMSEFKRKILKISPNKKKQKSVQKKIQNKQPHMMQQQQKVSSNPMVKVNMNFTEEKLQKQQQQHIPPLFETWDQNNMKSEFFSNDIDNKKVFRYTIAEGNRKDNLSTENSTKGMEFGQKDKFHKEEEERRKTYPYENQMNSNIKKMNQSPKRQIKKFIVINQRQQQDYDSDNGQYLNEKPYKDPTTSDTKSIYPKKPPQGLKRFLSFEEGLQNLKNKFGHESKKIKQKDQIKQQNRLLLNELKKIDKCQILRSVSKWSIGCKQSQSQSSIHSAYIDLIRNSNHFIYIENQFFMGRIEGEKGMKNQIALQIIKRIKKAIEQKQNFKVLIFMPLIPGFAGQLDDPEATLPRVIMHWQMLTIYKGQNSIIKSISKLTSHPEKYIQFYSLRTHNLINNVPLTEIVYLHSKMMIVDDKYAIIGSANINDRSMRGTRDSQIAVLTSRGTEVDSKMAGWPYKANKKIQELRIKLMKQHFGQIHKNDLDFKDMLNEQLFQQMQQIASTNTQFYHEIFGCYPDNCIKRLKQIKPFKKVQINIKKYQQYSSKVKGHVVHFPYKFLQDENLLQGNTLIPNILTN